MFKDREFHRCPTPAPGGRSGTSRAAAAAPASRMRTAQSHHTAVGTSLTWVWEDRPLHPQPTPTQDSAHTEPEQCIFLNSHQGARELAVGSRVLLPGACTGSDCHSLPISVGPSSVPEGNWPHGAGTRFCSSASGSAEPGCGARSRWSPAQRLGPGPQSSGRPTPEPRCRPLPPGPP